MSSVGAGGDGEVRRFTGSYVGVGGEALASLEMRERVVEKSNVASLHYSEAGVL